MFDTQKSWSQQQIDNVWSKGGILPDLDSSRYRVDACGAIIEYSKRGDTSSTYNFGWEIDHIDPNGGDEDLNLQPLQWSNNRSKSDKNPGTPFCVVTRKKNSNGSYSNIGC